MLYSQKQISILVVGFVILLAAVGGGAYYAGSSKKATSPPKDKLSAPPIATPVPPGQTASLRPNEVALSDLAREPAKYFNKTVVVRGIIYANKEGDKTIYTLLEDRPGQRVPLGISVNFDGFSGNSQDYVTVMPTSAPHDEKDHGKEVKIEQKVVLITGLVVQTQAANGQQTLALRPQKIEKL
jgi:hypothetical protein